MATLLRVCLFNPKPNDNTAGGDITGDDGPGKNFQTPFQRLTGIRILAECSTWQQLQEYLHSSRVDAVAVNLDVSKGNDRFTAVRRIVEVSPECGIIGISQDAHPDAIIAAMRAGCNQFVRWPIDQEDLNAAIERVRHVRLPQVSGCQRICVVGSSGGAGSTTIACNLAMELAHVTERSCALVDMDLQYGEVACSFDVKPRYTIADICHAGAEIDRTVLENALEDLACNVSILTRPEVELVEEVDVDSVEQMFRVMAQMFPFVVVDLPRYFSPPALVTLDGADQVLIITQLTIPHIRNATRIYEYLLRMGADESCVEVVLNRSNANFERITPEEVEKHFKRPIFASIPNDYKRIGASRDLGHPICTDSPNSPARLAIRDMAKILASEHLGEESVRTNAGLFGLFRRRHKKIDSRA